jgi:DNA gyrase subunit A
LKAYEIPESGRTARGTAIVNLLQLLPEERITAIIPLKEYQNDRFLFMATKNGIVKKTPIRDYENIRKSGLQAISLREDDDLIEVKSTNHLKDIFLITKNGMCIRFNEQDVRPTGRTSMGVIGMTLTGDDQVVGMQLNTQGKYLLFVSENGMGKRTDMEEFTVQYRGGKGVKCYKITEKTGDVIGVKAVDEENEIMLITTEGIIIRLMVKDISVLGRITSGVKLMSIDADADITVASLAKVRESNNQTSEEELIKNLEKELIEEDAVIDPADYPEEDYSEYEEVRDDRLPEETYDGNSEVKEADDDIDREE